MHTHFVHILCEMMNAGTSTFIYLSLGVHYTELRSKLVSFSRTSQGFDVV